MNHYYLLPFRFERIKEQELLVNELGDFIFVPTGTTERIIKRQLSNQEDLYKDLNSYPRANRQYSNTTKN